MLEGERSIEASQNTAETIRRTSSITEFFGQKIGWYWIRIRRFVLFLIVVELAVSLTTLLTGVNRTIADMLNLLLLPVELLVMGIVGRRVARDSSAKHAAVAGFFVVALVGLLMAVVKTIIVGQVWTVYNLITEPVFAGLVGAAVSGSVGAFVMRKSEQPKTLL